MHFNLILSPNPDEVVHYWDDCPDLDDDGVIAGDAHEVTCDKCKAQGL